MIEVEHLTKRYGTVTAVDDVSFRVNKGEILGFLGPNGAGKTTTMRVLTGYMPATDGRAAVAGYDVFEHPIEAKQRTGYLPETPPLYPDMTVREYLHFVAKIKGVAPKDRAARVDQVMARTWVDRHGRPRMRQAVEGLSPARRPRAGAHPQPRGADPRRADGGPRPQADQRDSPPHQGARRRSHHHPQHAHPHRGRADLPARGDHQQGQGRRRGHAGEPDRRLHGSATMFVQVDGDRAADAQAALARVDGVARVTSANDAGTAFEVESESGRDVRRELARAVVGGGWGLLELRPMRISLEDVFLSLTTEERQEETVNA